MTISADNPYEAVTIVDSNAPLDFPHPFEFNDEIVVTQDGVLLDQGTDYSVTGAGAPAGGSINPVDALVGSKWVIQRRTRLVQGTIPADAAVGFALDRIVKQNQDARRDIDRSIRVALSDEETILDLPPIEAGKSLMGNEAGTGFEFGNAAQEFEDDIVDLQNGLAQEVADRIADVGAEETARIAADNNLLALITGGGASPEDLRIFLDIENTDNTSDLNKPISNATAAALSALDGEKLDTGATAANALLLGGQTLAYVLALANVTGTIPDVNLPDRLDKYAKLITDWNDALENGWYMGVASNAPTGAVWYIGQVDAHNAVYVTQTVHSFQGDTSADTKSYRRSLEDGVWSAWYKLQLSQAEQDTRYCKFYIQAGDPGAVGAGSIWVTP